MSLENFVCTPLSVQDACTYTAIRSKKTGDYGDPDIIEFFNVVKNTTDPAMQQINVSRSKKNVIRGLHMSAFHKVVFCPIGKIFDVIVDLRPNSPTFMKWCGAWLDRDVYIYVPAYCAHGVFSAEDDSVISYYQGGNFFSHLDYGIKYNDPQVGVEWPKPIDADSYVLSEKDENAPLVNEELIEKIRFRMENPIEDRLTTTNCDYVVFGRDTSILIPMFEEMDNRGYSVFHSTRSASGRETVESIITAMRPKRSVIYYINTEDVSNQMDIIIEVMNIIHICTKLGNHATVIFNSLHFDGIDPLSTLLKEDFVNNFLILFLSTPIPPGKHQKELAEYLSSRARDIVHYRSLTDVLEATKTILDMSEAHKTGLYRLANIGSLDTSKVVAFCKSYGIDFNCDQNVLEDIFIDTIPIGSDVNDFFLYNH